MDCILGVVILVLGETDGSKTGYFFLTQIFIDFNGINVSNHELTVDLSPRNLIVRMHRDVLDLQDDVELLATLHGCVVPSLKLSADDLSVLSSHDLNTRIGPTVNIRVSRASHSTDIVTTAIRLRVPVLSFTQEDTVSGRHHDEGARGAGQDGGPAVMISGGLGSQGTDPGISAPRLLEDRYICVYLRRNRLYWIQLLKSLLLLLIVSISQGILTFWNGFGQFSVETWVRKIEY